jgi:hypothetical protein
VRTPTRQANSIFPSPRSLPLPPRANRTRVASLPIRFLRALHPLGFVCPKCSPSSRSVGFVWPPAVLFMFKRYFHYGFARWLRLRNLASFAENVETIGKRTKTAASRYGPQIVCCRCVKHRSLGLLRRRISEGQLMREQIEAPCKLQGRNRGDLQNNRRRTGSL